MSFSRILHKFSHPNNKSRARSVGDDTSDAEVNDERNSDAPTRSQTAPAAPASSSKHTWRRRSGVSREASASSATIATPPVPPADASSPSFLTPVPVPSPEDISAKFAGPEESITGFSMPSPEPIDGTSPDSRAENGAFSATLSTNWDLVKDGSKYGPGGRGCWTPSVRACCPGIIMMSRLTVLSLI
ncbi:hypothetical protein FA95DRAFT_711490 [Auriscalpium vulgare]|uniref:Uncharacterized protein n=1 Tax=Auriscalpium vulgare TaxID=40419 RepID=A0ACB8RCA2_9AGAM|nr:hypothetical protein FA95DRAFT_711490 [Auriscalpium vulgare]